MMVIPLAVGNHANPLDLQCYTCNINNDSSTDKTSDDVDTFNDNTVCGTSDVVDTFDDDTVYDGVPSAIFSSSDVDIDDEEDEVLHGKAIQSTDDDIDLIIADLNRFCLFAELRISSGLLYQDSSLAQDTNTHINDDYDLDMFDGELALMHNLTEITDDTENESTFELCIHTFSNDVNNL